jgi:4-oxalocrotonate tautomerase
MPIIIIETNVGKTREQKEGLVKDITDAVCKNFETTSNWVNIIIHENEPQNRALNGYLGIDKGSQARKK